MLIGGRRYKEKSLVSGYCGTTRTEFKSLISVRSVWGWGLRCVFCTIHILSLNLMAVLPNQQEKRRC